MILEVEPMWSSVIDLIVLSPKRQEQKVRLCKYVEWIFCDGNCHYCPKTNTYYSTGTKVTERKEE